MFCFLVGASSLKYILTIFSKIIELKKRQNSSFKRQETDKKWSRENIKTQANNLTTHESISQV